MSQLVCILSSVTCKDEVKKGKEMLGKCVIVRKIKSITYEWKFRDFPLENVVKYISLRTLTNPKG